MAGNIRLDRAVNIGLEVRFPDTLVSGDIDGDGRPDLLAGEGSAGEVAVLLNAGGGDFATGTTVATGTAPRTMALGDLNGDGAPDLVTAGGSESFAANFPNTVAVHLGDGGGGFGPATQITVGNNPTALALGDVNADGRGDLLVANEDDRTVSVLLANGNGGLTSAGTADSGRGLVDLALADLDGDGARDLLGVDGGDTLVVLQGNGSGGFAAPVEVAIDSTPGDTTGVEVGDFDRDGAPDVVTLNDGGTSTGNTDGISVLLNDGAGNLGPPTEHLTGSLPRDVSVVDLNRDGALDLAVTHQWSENVAILEGDGRGGFTQLRPAPINGSDETPRAATAADVDGDGFPELAVANEAAGGSVGVLANQSGEGLPNVEAELQWTTSFGTVHADSVNDIAVDSQGNVVVVGFQDQRASGEEDKPFIAKFNAAGEQLWFQNLGDDNESANRVAVDGDDNIFVTGTAGGTFGSLDFHINTQTGESGPGIRDIYLRKYSPGGESQWTQQFGSDDLDGDAHLTVDDAGNVFVASRSAGRFDSSHGQPNSEPDLAVTRFGNDGQFVWSRMFGSLGDPEVFGNDDEPDGIAIDPVSGELVVAGNTTGDLGNVDIDGGADSVADGEGSPDHAGTGEAFIVRLDPDSGDLLRTRQFETLDNDNVLALGVDSQGSTTVIGQTDGLPGQPPQVIEVTSPFAVNFDSNGERAWTRQDIPENQSTTASDIALAAGGLRLVSVTRDPAVLVYDDAGNLLTEITDEILSQADTGFGDGATNAVAVDGDTVYLAGSSDRAWAGPDLGDDDGWLVKLDLSRTTLEGPDLDLLDLSPAQQISAVYVGYFGRAPREGGLDFWQGEYDGGLQDGKTQGRVLDDIAESFRLSDEATTLFPFLAPGAGDDATSEDVRGFVTSVFENLFDRAPDPAGLDFWAGEIQARLDAGIKIGDIIMAIAGGAQNGNSQDIDGDGAAETLNDAATLLNKIDAATQFGRDVGEDIPLATARGFIADVGTSGQTVTDALDQLAELSVGINVGRSISAEDVDPFLA